MTLYQHQKDAIDFIFARGGNGALFMDCGTGKTLVALKAFEEMRKTEPALKLIAIMPLSILEAAWGEDIRKFTQFAYYNAHDKKIPKELKEDILLINYEAVILARNSGILNLMRGNMVVCDESSRLKGNTTRTAKFFLAARDLPKYKIVMTATPAPNTPLEYYAQMEFIKPGILHKSFYGFRNNYFHLQRGRQVMSGKLVTRAALFDAMRTGFKYEIAPQNLKKLMTKIEPYIFYARKKDCLDLPDQVDEVRKVTLSATQMRHYHEMKRDLITEIQGEQIVAQVALAKIIKLRELCSGFVINGKKTIELVDSAKITELKAVIEEAGDQSIIIWACFHWEIERIVKELGADNCRTFYAKTPDKDASLADFKSGKARFMVAHSASMGHGVTLTNCSMQIFFSLDYSLERYLQGRDRIHRIGQVNKCTYIHLIASGTIEEDILKCLKDKSDMTRIVEEMIR
jgi:SNF2 family DNA or RNA helicase